MYMPFLVTLLLWLLNTIVFPVDKDETSVPSLTPSCSWQHQNKHMCAAELTLPLQHFYMVCL